MKELSIGEEIRIRCVESDGLDRCSKCVFNQYGGDCGTVKCSFDQREDGNDVYFEIVK